jgi:hypothetical protein
LPTISVANLYSSALLNNLYTKKLDLRLALLKAKPQLVK